MKIVEFSDGFAIHGTFPNDEVLTKIRDRTVPLPLIIADPPYGNVVSDNWDRVTGTDVAFAEGMISWTRKLEGLSAPGGALYVWGGVGRPGFRPFYRYLIEAELRTEFKLADHITWAKKRAYGTSTRLLFCREECAYLVLGNPKKPRRFNVPYLDKLRGYPGYNLKYPARSPHLRRTNVWMDISEIFKGKIHTAQKPERLAEIMIETHTEPGEWVLDPFAGSFFLYGFSCP